MMRFEEWSAEKSRRERNGPLLCDQQGCFNVADWIFEDTVETTWRTRSCEGHYSKFREVYSVDASWSTIVVQPIVVRRS